jgi:hypothetical protein
MKNWILPVLLGLWTGTALAEDCDTYGQISPDEVDGYTGSEVTFRISEANNVDCGDADLCSWTVDGEPDVAGTLDEDFGSPVIWTAPDEIEDCSGYSIQIIAACADAADVGSSIITMYCDEEDKNAQLEQSRNTSVQGGGCGSTASGAYLVFLPLAFLGWRRR